jgi:predicted ferric reductase
MLLLSLLAVDGSLLDQIYRHHNYSSVSSLLFIAIPAIFIFGDSVSPLRWILPVVIVAWSIAMAMFRSQRWG